MRRGRIWLFLLLIVIIGLVVAFVAVRQFVLPQRTEQPQATNVEVFVAGQNIPQCQPVSADNLSTISVPNDKVNAAEFTADKQPQLIGKVAKFPLDQGTVITTAMVTDSGQCQGGPGPQWAVQIPPGMTAVSIPASRLSMVSFGVDDGAHVNLNACYLFVDVDPSFQSTTPDNTAVLTATGFPQNSLPVLSMGVGAAGGPQGRLELDPSLQQPFLLIPSEAQRPRPVCQTILQDVVVMKRGDFPISGTAAQATQQQQQQQQAAAPTPDVITLIVSPQDAVTLTYMVYTNAQMMMSLRNPSDKSRLATEAATLQFLLSQYNIPVPAKLPYALQPRIDALAAPVLPNDGATTTTAP
ncbi:MAG TPA: SAF domain-containing protein [Anaerolineales bacterium]|nr:SAF domain-containing protein [Anaerolineales bacterium]